MEFKNPERQWSAEAPCRGSTNHTTSTCNTFQKPFTLRIVKQHTKTEQETIPTFTPGHGLRGPSCKQQTRATNYLATTKRKRERKREIRR